MVERHHRCEATGALRSLYVVDGETIYLSGLHATDTAGDIKEQMAEVLATLDRLLADAGADKRTILTAHVWLKDMRYVGAMNKVWNGWIDPDHPPARTCVSGELYRPDVLVEVVATARRRDAAT